MAYTAVSKFCHNQIQINGDFMIKNFLDLCNVADGYITYLKEKNVKFNSNGFPIFKKDMFLIEKLELMVPFDFRKSQIVVHPNKTLLCFYCSDTRIYPRLDKVLYEISEYKKYLGAVATDVTITYDMDEAWQDFIMLVNQLFMAVLAVNGIKIVANLRTGNRRSHENLHGIPAGVMWATGFLGCRKDDIYDMRFISTILTIHPSILLIYGKNDLAATNKMSMIGMKYTIYSDYHKLCKEAA